MSYIIYSVYFYFVIKCSLNVLNLYIIQLHLHLTLLTSHYHHYSYVFVPLLFHFLSIYSLFPFAVCPFAFSHCHCWHPPPRPPILPPLSTPLSPFKHTVVATHIVQSVHVHASVKHSAVWAFQQSTCLKLSPLSFLLTFVPHLSTGLRLQQWVLFLVSVVSLSYLSHAHLGLLFNAVASASLSNRNNSSV